MSLVHPSVKFKLSYTVALAIVCAKYIRMCMYCMVKSLILILTNSHVIISCITVQLKGNVALARKFCRVNSIIRSSFVY